MLVDKKRKDEKKNTYTRLKTHWRLKPPCSCLSSCACPPPPCCRNVVVITIVIYLYIVLVELNKKKNKKKTYHGSRYMHLELSCCCPVHCHCCCCHCCCRWSSKGLRCQYAEKIHIKLLLLPWPNKGCLAQLVILLLINNWLVKGSTLAVATFIHFLIKTL